MKVLVTGGAGYMGTELINLLVSNEAVEKVIIYDNLSRMNYNLFLGLKLQKYPKLVFVKGELLDSRSLKKALKDIDVVFHMAAKVTASNTIDIYQPTKEHMKAWGVRNVNIRVLRWGSFSKSLAIMKDRAHHTHVRKMVQRIGRSS